jgi:16S rRNA G1207 methylase RsmC
MNTLFEVNALELTLERFPCSNDENLQAWDSADQYLLEHIEQLDLAPSKILIINDTFGTLTCGLNRHQLINQSDSYISHQASRFNLERNYLTPDIEYITQIEQLTIDVDLVVIKLPKSNSMLIEQLRQLSNILSPDTLVIAGAKAKDIHSSTLSLFEQHLGTTTTSLARKKSRLIFCQPKAEKLNQALSTQLKTWSIDSPQLTISNLPGVFANTALDIGARLLLENIPTNIEQRNVIDLGCGNGVLGLAVAAKNPDAQVTFSDESFMAVESARLNVTNNIVHPERCDFIWNDCLSDIEFDSTDWIICNPPFHQLQTITDHIAWQMFKDAYRVLKRGGKLRIVGNRHLGYHIKLQRIFDNCTTIASNGKFVILEAKKR